MKQILRAFASIGFIGRIPFAPGTMGSLAALPVVYVWNIFFSEQILLTLILLFLLFLLGVFASGKVEGYLDESDPSEIVIDEFVGQWIALLAVPEGWPYWLAAFLLFRLFDIWKPSIINNSQKLPGGLGIMIDDVLAGVFAFLLIQGVAALL